MDMIFEPEQQVVVYTHTATAMYEKPMSFHFNVLVIDPNMWLQNKIF